MRVLWFCIVLMVVLSACGPKQVDVPLPEPSPERFTDFLKREKGVSCEEIIQMAEGDDSPMCERIFHYHMEALDRLKPLLGERVYDIKMENVRYFRPVRVEMPPSVPSPVIAREDHVIRGRVFRLPVFARITNLVRVRQFGNTFKMTYLIEYGTEENIMCEELHRVFQEMDPSDARWGEVGHGTENDPLKFDCAAWEHAEYRKNNPDLQWEEQ